MARGKWYGGRLVVVCMDAHPSVADRGAVREYVLVFGCSWNPT